jgi:hypothetical protein
MSPPILQRVKKERMHTGWDPFCLAWTRSAVPSSNSHETCLWQTHLNSTHSPDTPTTRGFNAGKKFVIWNKLHSVKSVYYPIILNFPLRPKYLLLSTNIFLGNFRLNHTRLGDYIDSTTILPVVLCWCETWYRKVTLPLFNHVSRRLEVRGAGVQLEDSWSRY